MATNVAVLVVVALLAFCSADDPSARGRAAELSVSCSPEALHFVVKTRFPFNGVIFAGSDTRRAPKCRISGHGGNQHELSVPLQQCGVTLRERSSDGNVYGIVVYVQYNGVIQRLDDDLLYNECTVGPSSARQRHGGATKSPTEDTWMEIIRDERKRPVRGAVALGDSLTMRVKVPKSDGANDGRSPDFDSKVVQCRVHDNSESVAQFLIDERGCPTDPSIFPAFQRNDNDYASNHIVYSSTFKAFKFPDAAQVHFRCKVLYCQGQCRPQNCSTGRHHQRHSLQPAPPLSREAYNAQWRSPSVNDEYIHSRRRRALSDRDERIYERLPLYNDALFDERDVVNGINVVNDPKELALVDSDDDDSTRFHELDENRLFCMPAFQFWWIIMMLLLLLLVAFVVALLFWMRRRRRRQHKGQASNYYYGAGSSESGGGTTTAPTPTSSYPYAYAGGASGAGGAGYSATGDQQSHRSQRPQYDQHQRRID